jgi:class 3 adenylate cyclase
LAAFITRKKSALICFCAFLAAGGCAVLLDYLLAGPRLGPHYDLLLDWRKRPAPAQELLIVDSGDLIEGDAAAEMILTLTEMDAAALVIQTPVLGFSGEKAGSEEEIRSWFEDEFSLLERNIRGLFEAIRTGSVAPAEVRRYVDELVGLTGQGKERLAAALIHQGGAGAARLEQAAAAFGRVYQPGDLRLSSGVSVLARTVPFGGPSYSRPQGDWDGRVRRINPLGPPEHVAYAALKGRFTESYVGKAGEALFLVKTAKEGTAHIPLDSRGNLLFEPPPAKNPGAAASPDQGFRRIPLELFTRYEEGEQALRRLLREADKLGIYGALAPERSPPYLFEYAQAQREEFLASLGSGAPSGPLPAEWKARWQGARNECFAVLEEFLYNSPAEEDLKAGYKILLASEQLNEEGMERLGAFRDAIGPAFEGLRGAFAELRALRDTLSRNLSGAVVILGPREGPEKPGGEAGGRTGGFFRLPVRRAYSDSELSFILADNILRGRGIRPAGRRTALLWALLAAGLEILVLARLRPPLSLAAGLAVSLALGAGFAGAFVFSGVWLDPLIPLGASLAGTFTVFALGLLTVRRGARRFLLAYGPYVGKSCLKELIRAGRPAPASRIRVQAAVIAVREAGLLAREDRGLEEFPQGAQMAAAFREEVSALFKGAGGVILGCDGDLVLACFGSPLERIGTGPGRDPYLRYSHSPALRAAEFAAELAAQKPQWQFGVDAGECGFAYQPVSGYTAYGRPVVRARILSGLGGRCQARVLISEPVRSQVNHIPVRRIAAFKDQNGSQGEAFYELILPR